MERLLARLQLSVHNSLGSAWVSAFSSSFQISALAITNSAVHCCLHLPGWVEIVLIGGLPLIDYIL